MDSITSKIIISTNFSDIDQDFVVLELKNSYWANTRPKEMTLFSLSHSLCYSALLDGKQIAFMRVVTDYSTFAYLCDVIVKEEYRGLGIAQKMLQEVLDHPQLKNVKWVLRTKDAHGVYEKVGFFKMERPDRYMEK